MTKNPKNNLHTFVVLAYKESPYLNTCLKSVLNQTENSNVVIATTTENDFIKKSIQTSTLKLSAFYFCPSSFLILPPPRWAKRFALKFGCSICCPAVTFVRANCPQKIFTSNFKCNVDWSAWEKLSRSQKPFTFIPEPLMGHRISEESTTTEIINSGIRTKEDYEIFCRFWPQPIAKALAKVYQKSEKSNDLNTD